VKLSFRAKLLASTLGLVVAVEAVALIIVDRSLAADLAGRLDARLAEQAAGVAEWLRDARHPEKLAPRLKRVVGARVTIYDRFGVILGDSDAPALIGRGEGAAPEVWAARRGSVGKASRDSDLGPAVHTRFVAVALPSGLLVRLAAPMSEVDDTLAELRRRLLLAAAAAFVSALGLALVAARRIAAPLRAATASAARIARGDFAIATPHDAPRDEFGELDHSLATLAAQLSRLETMRRDFVANLSHELGTPVAAIQGSAETLLGRAPAELREFLEVIERHSRRIARLTEDLLHLARLEAEPGRAVREPVELAAVAAEVARTVDGRGARVLLEVDESAVALGDPGALEQVLENLVDNAIKYGREGGQVRITGGRAGGRVKLVVADDGPGIEARHLPRLFERFYRVDPGRSRERGGTGLGLAIVKHLVEAMGGTVAVVSEVGAGTRFTVELPAV